MTVFARMAAALTVGVTVAVTDGLTVGGRDRL